MFKPGVPLKTRLRRFSILILIRFNNRHDVTFSCVTLLAPDDTVPETASSAQPRTPGESVCLLLFFDTAYFDVQHLLLMVHIITHQAIAHQE